MNKKTRILVSALAAIITFSSFAVAYAAPTFRIERTILPETDSTYELGTSTKAWLRINSDIICLTGDSCITTWPSGSGSSGIATSTPWTEGDLVRVLDNGTVISIATSSLGLLTTDVAEGSNLYFTNARADARVAAATTTIRGMFSGTSPVAYNSTTGDFSIASDSIGDTQLAFNTGQNLTTASSPTFSALTLTTLTLGSDAVTDLTGSGILNTGGALTLDRTGAWTGTFDGQEGSYYLDRANHSGTQTIASNIFNLTGLSDGCIQIATNQLTSTGAACGAGGGSSGLATSSPWTAGNLAYVIDNGTVSSVATTTLSGNSQVAVSNSPVLIGASPAVLSIVGDSIGDTQLAFNTGQDLTTTSNPTFAALTVSTLDTGQGANELFDMDQNVLQASTPTFGGLTLTPLTSALLVTNGSGVLAEYAGTSCTNQFIRSISALGAATCETIANTDLANSTISGISLGSNLADLTATNSTLTFSGAYNGGTARTIGLNLGNANTWTAHQNFSTASSTSFSTGNLYVGTTATTTISTNGSITMPANSTFTMGTTTAGTLKTTSSGLVYADTSSSGSTASSTPRVYTASDTWTKPAGLAYIIVEVQAGGGGAGACSDSGYRGSGGGGGGGYSREIIPAAALAGTETVTVGGVGAGGTGFGNGSTGGTSSFGSFLSASGGAGSVYCTTAGASGAGGTGTGGDLNLTGQDGALSVNSSGAPPYMTGAGGDSFLGKGGKGSRSTTSTLFGGVAGVIYGGGASGVFNGSSGSDNDGAAGAQGVVIVTEVF